MRQWQIDAGAACDCGKALVERFGIVLRPALHLELSHCACTLQLRSCSISLNGLARFCCSGASWWFSSQERNASVDSKNSDGREQIRWVACPAEAVSAFGSLTNLPSERFSPRLRFPVCTARVRILRLTRDVRTRRCDL